MSSSAVDARVVIAVSKILDAGCVIYSEKLINQFHVLISVPDEESFSGWGKSFPEAFNDAYRQLPEREAAVAA